jgi:hypothetical protein
VLATAALAPIGAPDAASAAPPGDDTVVAFLVRGVGNGHGRGLSQWGAYGRALDGQTWTQILDAYYGGTTNATRTMTNMSVRLTKWDGAAAFGVVSFSTGVVWNGQNYTSMYARETSNGSFTVYGTDERACPGGVGLAVPTVDLVRGDVGDDVADMQRFLASFGYDPGPIDGSFGGLTEAAVREFQAAYGLTVDGAWHEAEWKKAQAIAGGGTSASWTTIGTTTDVVTFATSALSQSSASKGDVLGACEPDGSITHYRGQLDFRSTADGNRVINRLDIENYLRGVLPKEVPASWGSGGGGSGMHALRAQSVAARSYAMSQSRYSYALTCDTSSCQVYGGAAERGSAGSAGFLAVEQTLTDTAIRDTAGTVRVRGSDIVSTEFSASNGPRTAGGSYPAVDDPWDDQPGNPNHRWTRIIDADSLAAFCGISDASAVRTQRNSSSIFDGVWSNRLVNCPATSDPLALRNSRGYPTHGFDLIPIRREATTRTTFSFIGDSVGVGVAGSATSPFRMTLDGVFASSTFDALVSRRTEGGSIPDGVGAAESVPRGTDHVIVQLGYNDDAAAMPDRIDSVMTALRARDVGTVIWVNLSERRPQFAGSNDALDDAMDRWSNLIVADWESASDHAAASRWFSDGVHLTATGQAEFSSWLRAQLMLVVTGNYTPARQLLPGEPLRVPVLGQFGIPKDGSVAGVALNVTAVGPTGPGWLRAWPCGSAEPGTSSVNYMAAGAVEPNAVLVPVDDTGEVCISTLTGTDVIVDVAGWFDGGINPATGRVVDTRDDATDLTLRPGRALRVPVTGVAGVPDDGTAVGVALNVTAVGTAGPGWLRVWSCDDDEPDTSSVNYTAAGAIEPNAVVVPVGASGEVCVSTLTRTEVIVDVSGWFDAGLQAGSGRLVDTRDDTTRRTLRPGSDLRVPVTGRFGVPDDGTALGVALNVTAVDPNGPGWVRVWSCDAPEPDTSSVNYLAAGAIEPNAVVVPVGASGEVCLSTLTDTEVIVDLTGWFDSGLRAASGRLADTRIGLGPAAPR